MQAMDDSIVVLEEDVLSHTLTEDEVRIYAVEQLGMQLPQHDGYLWIAKEGLRARLPEDWKPCKVLPSHAIQPTINDDDEETSADELESAVDTEVFYFNFNTGQSQWEHPCIELYRQKFAEMLQKDKKEEEKRLLQVTEQMSSEAAKKENKDAINNAQKMTVKSKKREIVEKMVAASNQFAKMAQDQHHQKLSGQRERRQRKNSVSGSSSSSSSSISKDNNSTNGQERNPPLADITCVNESDKTTSTTRHDNTDMSDVTVPLTPHTPPKPKRRAKRKTHKPAHDAATSASTIVQIRKEHASELQRLKQHHDATIESVVKKIHQLQSQVATHDAKQRAARRQFEQDVKTLRKTATEAEAKADSQRQRLATLEIQLIDTKAALGSAKRQQQTTIAQLQDMTERHACVLDVLSQERKAGHKLKVVRSRRRHEVDLLKKNLSNKALRILGLQRDVTELKENTAELLDMLGIELQPTDGHVETVEKVRQLMEDSSRRKKEVEAKAGQIAALKRDIETLCSDIAERKLELKQLKLVSRCAALKPMVVAVVVVA